MTDNTPDPVLPLTDAEKALIQQLNATGNRVDLLAELEELLQAAIWVELATIPIYLYTYYSINRTPAKAFPKKSKEWATTRLGRYADKAGGLIMSVAVEEMLHMTLSSNIYFALTGKPPELYMKSPPWEGDKQGSRYPTNLPGHNLKGPDGKPLAIDLAAFSESHLWQFLEIEYPTPYDSIPQDKKWDTIGQIYAYIRCVILSDHIRDSDFQRGIQSQQCQGDNYSSNNIDTAYPSAPFNKRAVPGAKESAASVAEYGNRDDSHAGDDELISVIDKNTALEAIATICFQGEGFAGERWDDQSDQEESHYYKFLTLQAELEGYDPNNPSLKTPPPIPPASASPISATDLHKVVFDFPVNPVASEYTDGGCEALANVCNALYQYMLIMTETVYKVPPEGQKAYFNQALHMSMIWILDKLIQAMRDISTEVKGPGQTQVITKRALAPTFENLSLGARQDAYAAMCARAAKFSHDYGADKTFKNAMYYVGMIKDLPDVSGYWGGTSVAQSAELKQATGEAKPDFVPGDDPTLPKFPAKDPAVMPPGVARHACMGLNACKNQGRTLQNDCAGQGYCSTAVDHTCHVKNSCKHQGGCGLYGTVDEQSYPGRNECKSLGSCATPINAERFSTEGDNASKSVWHRAREVFTAEVWPALRERDPSLPETPPMTKGSQDNPELFKDGPTMWWIEDYSCQGMSACGASGMSGAGSCV